MEWDYGNYEGLTSAAIRQKNPAWNLFHDGAPNGETPAHAAARADQILKKLHGKQGNIAIFSHGHFSRVLAARWLGLPVERAAHFFLSTSSISILSSEHELPVIRLWNDTGHL
jgi:probable phosphoglycerate mutase